MLALGPKLGPVLWQLPPTLGFDAARMDAFFRLLPRTTTEAAALSLEHDARLEGRSWTTTDADRPLRYAVEVRHDTFRDPGFVSLCRDHDVAVVVADTAGKWPMIDEHTADHAYARLHGESELYVSGYDDDALDRWAERVRGVARVRPRRGRLPRQRRQGPRAVRRDGAGGEARRLAAGAPGPLRRAGARADLGRGSAAAAWVPAVSRARTTR